MTVQHRAITKCVTGNKTSRICIKHGTWEPQRKLTTEQVFYLTASLKPNLNKCRFTTALFSTAEPNPESFNPLQQLQFVWISLRPLVQTKQPAPGPFWKGWSQAACKSSLQQLKLWMISIPITGSEIHLWLYFVIIPNQQYSLTGPVGSNFSSILGIYLMYPSGKRPIVIVCKEEAKLGIWLDKHSVHHIQTAHICNC